MATTGRSGPSGLVIPTNLEGKGGIKDQIQKQVETIDSLKQLDAKLGNLVKFEVIRRQLTEEANQQTESMNARIEKMVKMQELTGTPAMTLVKKKLLEKYRKVFIQGKWFESVAQSLKDFLKSSGSWIADLLGFLAVLSIFDPNGEFLASIITFFVHVIIMLTNMLARMLPAFLKLILPLVPILIRAVWQGIKALAGALGEVIAILLKELFGISLPTGPVGQFFKTFLGGLATFAILAAKFPILMAPLKFLFSWLGTAAEPLVRKAVNWILPALGKLGASLLGMLGPILIVVAVIAALIAIWVYAKEIVAFFDGLIDRFKHMSKGMQLLVVALAILFFPLTIFIGAIYFLAKAFKRIQEVGIKQWFSEILQAVVDFFPGLRDSIMGFFASGGLLDGILKPLKAIWGAITGFFTDLDKMSFADAFSNLLDNLGGAIWDLMKGFFNLLVAYWKFIFVTIPIFIGEQVVRFVKWIVSVWPTIWKYIKIGFMFILGLFKTFITMYFLILTWPLRKLWKWVKETILPAIRGAWDELIDLGSKIFRKIKSLFNPQNLLDEVRGLMGGMFDPIIAQASSAFTKVWGTYIEPILNRIGAFFSATGEFFKHFLNPSDITISRAGGASSYFAKEYQTQLLQRVAPELSGIGFEQLMNTIRAGSGPGAEILGEIKRNFNITVPPNATDEQILEVMRQMNDNLRGQTVVRNQSAVQIRSAF